MRKRSLIMLVVLAGTAFVLAACGGSDEGAGSSSATITVVGGEPEGGVQTIEATKGETIHLTVESDTPGEAHLHGYDIEKEVAPGEPASFDFEATLDGIFEVELHQGADETQIGELRVEP